MNDIFEKLQNEMKQFIPNEEIRLDTDTNSILGYHGSVRLGEAEFTVKTLGAEKTVKGWSVTMWVTPDQYRECPEEPDDYVDDKLVGNYRTEEQARFAFIKTVFECKLSTDMAPTLNNGDLRLMATSNKIWKESGVSMPTPWSEPDYYVAD